MGKGKTNSVPIGNINLIFPGKMGKAKTNEVGTYTYIM